MKPPTGHNKMKKKSSARQQSTRSARPRSLHPTPQIHTYPCRRNLTSALSTKSLKLETTTKISKMVKKRKTKNKNKRMTKITTRKPIWMTTIKTPITKRTNMMN